MATQVQLRRGTSAWHQNFTGAAGETTVNTTDFSLHVHDGVTPGGHKLQSAQEGVASFKSRAGAVVPQAGDYSAAQVSVAPASGLAATDVQAALVELDRKKLATPTNLPETAVTEGDWLPFADISNRNTLSRTTVGGLFTSRILTTPELRGYYETVAAPVPVSKNQTIATLAAGNVQRFVLSGNVTLTLPNLSLPANTGAALSVAIVQDGTGNRSVTFAAPGGESIVWDCNASQPAIAAGPNEETLFSFYRIAESPAWKGVRTHKGG